MPTSRTIILAFVIISCLNIPRNIINVFGLHFLLFGNDLPYLAPFCLLLLTINLSMTKGNAKLLIGTEDVYFVIALLTWTLLEYYHNIEHSGANLYIVLSNFWFLVFYFLLKTYVRLSGIEVIKELMNTTAYIITAVLLFHLALQGIARYSGGAADFINESELFETNGMSLIALFLIHLILFYMPVKTRMERLRLNFILIPLCIFVIILNESRGALILLFLIFLIKTLLFTSLSKQAIIAGVLILFVLIFIRYFDTNWVVQQSEFIYKSFSSEPVDMSADLVYHLPSSFVSSYQRITSIKLGLQSFSNNPIIGSGLVEAHSIRVAGYIIHSYYIFPLVAYGLIGIIPYILSFHYILKKGYIVMPRETIASLVFIIGAMTFDNEMSQWYALLFIFIRYSRYINEISKVSSFQFNRSTYHERVNHRFQKA